MSVGERLEREQRFHDAWAETAELPKPSLVNEALTSPELRYIHARLGDVSGKTLLDLGCGLGEASVYFAIRGAKVTAVDLSPEMLRATERLAKHEGVTLATHQGASETLGLQSDARFDIIYVGNLFHHVNIGETLDVLLPHLHDDGILVSWDPVAYNPLINIYRAIATEVRTIDEHPLKAGDLKLLRSRFTEFESRFFWLTSLLIFMIMALSRNPNKIRFWKAIVDESESWRWLYVPLSAVDRVLLKIFPPLKWLCWNVVIFARKPRRHV